MREMRARQKDGHPVMCVWVDKHGLAEMLLEAGLLSCDKSEDCDAIAKGLQRLIDIYMMEYDCL
jgi:hypothetical protein